MACNKTVVLFVFLKVVSWKWKWYLPHLWRINIYFLRVEGMFYQALQFFCSLLLTQETRMGEAWHVCNQSFILELWAQILPSLLVVEHHVRHFRVRSELNWNQKFIILVDLIQQLVETGPLFGCGKLLCSFVDIFVFAFFFLVFEFIFLFFLQCSKKGRDILDWRYTFWWKRAGDIGLHSHSCWTQVF